MVTATRITRTNGDGLKEYAFTLAHGLHTVTGPFSENHAEARRAALTLLQAAR